MYGTPTTTGPTEPGRPAGGRCSRCGQHADNLAALSGCAAMCWPCRMDHSAARRNNHGSGRGDHIDRQLRRIRPRGKRR